MRKNYIVAPGQEFEYPANEESLRIVREAGGLRNLSEEAKFRVIYKKVKEGEDCSDMPSDALELYVQRGQVLAPETESILEPVIEQPVEQPVAEQIAGIGEI